MRVVLMLLVGVLVTSSAHAQIIFSTDFNTANAGCGTNCYGFHAREVPDGVKWSLTNLPRDGWGGSGAPQITIHAGQEQYSLGWYETNRMNVSAGQSVFVRWRMKFASGHPTASHKTSRQKFIAWSSGRNRVIIFAAGPNDWVCGLSSDQNQIPTTGWKADASHHEPNDYGSSGAWSGRYRAIVAGQGIAGPATCAAPPILLSGDGATLLSPGYRSSSQWGTYPGAATTDGWYHIQVEARCGPAGSAYFKQWANENDYAKPQSLQNPLRDSGGNLWPLGCTDWADLGLGHYQDTRPSTDLTYIVDDLVVSRAYDASWYPGGSPSSPASQTVRVRIRAEEFAALLMVPLIGWRRRRREK